MNLSAFRRLTRHGGFTMVVVVALLAAQWLGLQHGIAHSGLHVAHALSSKGAAGPSTATSSADESYIDDLFGHAEPTSGEQGPIKSSSTDHSCAAFEAGTLASLLTGFVLVLDFALPFFLPPPEPIALGYLPPPLRLFQSRAPPPLMV